MTEQIHQLACTDDPAGLFATGLRNRHVRVWSFPARQKIGELETVLDSGGERLALTGGKSPLVVTGSWNEGCVAAYRCDDGLEAWRRTDLDQTQRVTAISPESVAVGRAQGPLEVLDVRSGETRFRIPETGFLIPSRRADVAFCRAHSGLGWAGLYQLQRQEFLWRVASSPRGPLDAAFAPDAVAVADGDIDCFDLSGEVVWRWQPPDDVEVIRLGWYGAEMRWVGVLSPNDEEAPFRLISLDRDGELRSDVLLDDLREVRWICDGRWLVTSNGVVLSVPDAREVWTFATDADAASNGGST